MKTRWILVGLALSAAAGLAACRGSTAEGCPRAGSGDWARVRANTRDFEISLCLPPDFRPVGALAWARPSAGDMVTVENGLVHMGARAVLSACVELDVTCGAGDSPSIEELKKDLRLRDQRATVLETGLLTGGPANLRRASAALLRVELGPDQFAVVRGIERAPDRIGELRRILGSVRFERLGGAGTP